MGVWLGVYTKVREAGDFGVVALVVVVRGFGACEAELGGGACLVHVFGRVAEEFAVIFMLFFFVINQSSRHFYAQIFIIIFSHILYIQIIDFFLSFLAKTHFVKSILASLAGCITEQIRRAHPLSHRFATETLGCFFTQFASIVLRKLQLTLLSPLFLDIAIPNLLTFIICIIVSE